MNVTSPSSTHSTQSTASTLPIKRNTDSAAGKSTTGTPSLPSNPPHLGNSIDTKA